MTQQHALLWISIFAFTGVRRDASEINWTQNLETAFAASAKSGKPALAFKSSESRAVKLLDSSLLREAIESEFHPALIITESNASSAQFFDHSQNKIASIPLANIEVASFAVEMIAAIQKSNQDVPLYLKALSGEASADSIGTVAFAMFCFWTGEQKLGGLNGVLTTEAGWFEHREVTRVTFDRSILSFETLLSHALSYDCAKKVFTTNDEDTALVNRSRLSTSELTDTYRKAKSSDQKRQLSDTIFQKLDLTPVQATKVNAFARTEPKEALKWLSPSQLAQLK